MNPKQTNNQISKSLVFVSDHSSYNANNIYNSLNDEVFNLIKPGDYVVLKPNWIRESHISRENEWEQVITHPTVVTAVFRKVVDKLQGKGRISVIDGPETASSFKKILSYYPIDEWKEVSNKAGITIEIIDLRDDEWVNRGNVTIERKKLPGDPRGNVTVNLKEDASEFDNHRPKNGYYGADSNITETNKAHNGIDNLYRVSKTIIEADVFINLPKLKTHKKAGITSCLKNLVGINTYKNYLPHNSIGTTVDGGDQFPEKNTKSAIESSLMPFIHQHILTSTILSRLFEPVMSMGKKIFGDNSKIIRGGSWYGNDTLWRMVLDLNKVLFYANPDGSLREDNLESRKKYIAVVDGIIGGEGNGPKAPDAKKLGRVFCGTDPVAVDAVSSVFIGFDPQKIPSIKNAFEIKKYQIVDFEFNCILAKLDEGDYSLYDIPSKHIKKFEPHHGWKDHIELEI
jgi:uncharacterized protein (DUF362 family)